MATIIEKTNTISIVHISYTYFINELLIATLGYVGRILHQLCRTANKQ